MIKNYPIKSKHTLRKWCIHTNRILTEGFYTLSIALNDWQFLYLSIYFVLLKTNL